MTNTVFVYGRDSIVVEEDSYQNSFHVSLDTWAPIEYSVDVSAHYGNRSIVDKEYVDTTQLEMKVTFETVMEEVSILKEMVMSNPELKSEYEQILTVRRLRDVNED